MRILNIYGQEYWHCDALIVGNKEGLEALKQTIDEALRVISKKASTKDDKEPFFASDGEGYEVIVELHDEEWGIKAPKDSFWNKRESYPEYWGLKSQQF